MMSACEWNYAIVEYRCLYNVRIALKQHSELKYLLGSRL
jgi:hypothetical protein